MKYLTPSLSLLTTAVKKVASYVVKDHQELLYMHFGNNQTTNFANHTAIFLQRKLVEDISAIKPDYCFLIPGQQFVQNKDQSNVVVVTGLTGFQQFSRGLANFTISLTLMRDNKPLSAVVYQPLLDHLYTAETGKGAFFNKRKLKASTTVSRGSSMLIATDCELNFSQLPKNVTPFSSNCPVLDLCNLASGRINGIIYGKPISYLKSLAGIVIAQEADCNLSYQKEQDCLTKFIADNCCLSEHLLNLEKIFI